MSIEHDSTAEDRFTAACELARDAGTDDEHLAWCLVANYLEELHHVSSA